MSPDGVRALALGQLRGMLSAGHDIATASERVASRLPAGDVRDEMVRAAWAIAGGADPAIAFGEALPKELTAIVSGEEGASLASRIELLSEHLNRAHRLTSRLTSLLWYPFQLSLGAAIVFLFVLVLRVMNSAAAYEAGFVLPMHAITLASVMIGGLFGLTAWALVSARRGRIPGWSTVLPGGAIERTTDLAQVLSLLALHLDDRAGKTTLGDALRAAVKADPTIPSSRAERAAAAIDGGTPLPDALRALGLPAREVRLLELGDRSGKLVTALRRAVSRLENESAVQARQLTHATGVFLLGVTGLAILTLWLAQTPTITCGGFLW